MKTVLSSQGSHELKHNHIGSLTDICLYFNNCYQDKREICQEDYERCIVYQRFRVLDRNKTKTGLERFRERYKDFDYGKQLGIGS